MTLDEAIKHAEEVIDEKKKESCDLYDAKNYEESRECIWCAEEHRQLAQWLKELKQLREQTKWIPVTERLPDDYDRYLITTDDGRVEIIGYGYTDDLPDEIAFHEWDDEGWQCWKPNVTAWMPLPTPFAAKMQEVENG